jgi:hypothetical protein
MNYRPYPICSRGPLDFPYTYRIDGSGNKEDFNEQKLMNYYGVKNRSMDYIMACFMIINKNCLDFLKEYSAICKNEYLLEEHYRYYPFRDETALNVCFWKRGINDNLGHRFVNTHKFSTIKMVEESDNIQNTTIDNNIYEYCKNSGHVWFYHGTKIPEENKLIFDYYGTRNL